MTLGGIEQPSTTYFAFGNYEGQSMSNASYFFSPLLFKKTQIQLHSLRTTVLISTVRRWVRRCKEAEGQTR